MCGMVHRDRSEVSSQGACPPIAENSSFLSDFALSANSLFTLRRSDQIFSGNNSCQASNNQDPQALSRLKLSLEFQSVYIDADIYTVNQLSAAIIYVAPSNYVGAVSILVNCSDHGNFGNDNNVCGCTIR